MGTVARWIHGLHTVEYGGLTARLLIFVLAVAGCLTILSGNWIWLERRRQRTPTPGNALLGRLTAGVGGGTLVAVAALLLGSRLMSLDWPGRTRAEELILAGTFLGSIGFALAAPQSRATWSILLGLAGLLLAAVPLAATRHSQAGLLGQGPRHATVAAVEIGFWLASAALVAGALRIRALRNRSLAQRPADGVVRDPPGVPEGQLAHGEGRMSATLTCALLYLAAALGYGAGRGGARLPVAATPGAGRAARAAALLAALAAFATWRTREPGPAAFLVVGAGLLVMSAVVTVLAPLWPRPVWGAALVCLVAAPCLALAGAFP